MEITRTNLCPGTIGDKEQQPCRREIIDNDIICSECGYVPEKYSRLVVKILTYHATLNLLCQNKDLDKFDSQPSISIPIIEQVHSELNKRNAAVTKKQFQTRREEIVNIIGDSLDKNNLYMSLHNREYLVAREEIVLDFLPLIKEVGIKMSEEYKIGDPKVYKDLLNVDKVIITTLQNAICDQRSNKTRCVDLNDD